MMQMQMRKQGRRRAACGFAGVVAVNQGFPRCVLHRVRRRKSVDGRNSK